MGVKKVMGIEAGLAGLAGLVQGLVEAVQDLVVEVQEQDKVLTVEVAMEVAMGQEGSQEAMTEGELVVVSV